MKVVISEILSSPTPPQRGQIDLRKAVKSVQPSVSVLSMEMTAASDTVEGEIVLVSVSTANSAIPEQVQVLRTE